MRIAMIASEGAPFIKTGGLGDVMQALPEALAKQPHNEIVLVLPCYKRIKETYGSQLEFITSFEVNLGWRRQYVGVLKLHSRRKKLRIYFIDNDDLFHRRKGVADDRGVEYADNDERVIFYARGSIETVKKLRWTPNIILCSGWMSALAPLYLKRAYNDEPFFANSKVVLMLDDKEYQKPFPTKFSEKLRIDGITNTDVRSIAGFPVGYEELMRLAVDYSDAIIYATPKVNQRVANYAETKGKPILAYQEMEDAVAASKRQWDFFQGLLGQETQEND